MCDGSQSNEASKPHSSVRKPIGGWMLAFASLDLQGTGRPGQEEDGRTIIPGAV